MEENEEICYKHCLNCEYNNNSGFCEIKHTDSDFCGRIKALFCRFFKHKKTDWSKK